MSKTVVFLFAIRDAYYNPVTNARQIKIHAIF